MSPAPVHVVKGDDESLLRAAVHELVDRLVGDEDRSLALEQIDVAATAAEDRRAQLAALVDSVRTPPFLTAHRVVVGWGVHTAKADELTGLAEAVADLLPSTYLVIVWASGAVPKRLADAVKAAGGETVATSAGTKKRDWIAEQLRHHHLKLDAAAVALLAEHLGEDVGRLPGLIETLEATYGAGRPLTTADIEPYLGEAGSLAPWELTDAIDRGDIPGSLDRLHRMMAAGDRHALVLLATLTSHYGRMLALDGADVRGEKDAAELLGMRGSTFPAKKALNQARRLGSTRVATAVSLLARADRDLRGERGWEDGLVMEVLVARLANLGAAARP